MRFSRLNAAWATESGADEPDDNAYHDQRDERGPVKNTGRGATDPMQGSRIDTENPRKRRHKRRAPIINKFNDPICRICPDEPQDDAQPDEAFDDPA